MSASGYPFINRANIEIAEVDLEQGRLARQAHSRFGKGHHPAGLDSGGCFAYALAVARGESLLYKGGDFARTDGSSAISRQGDGG